MPPSFSYSLFPLGDAALLIDFGNVMDENTNEKVLRLFHRIKNSSLPYITDVVPAYSSIAVYYHQVGILEKNQRATAFEAVAEKIKTIIRQEDAFDELSTDDKGFKNSKDLSKLQTHHIPVCYAPGYALDVEEIAQRTKLSAEEIIHLHTARIYRVYMVGFLPGFAYMGEVDDRMAVPRKPQPRTDVAAGAVGIAGKQTGIYPLASPGGWQIIGRTPLQLFNKNKKSPVLLQPGDKVQFYAITEDEFVHYKERRS